MKFNIFLGKLGNEELMMAYDWNEIAVLPCKGDLVYLPTRDEDDIVDGDTYVVKQVLNDLVHNEYNIFVELYDWED